MNQGLATLAFFGVGVNLVLFLTRVLDQENADAANSVSKWTGTVYLCSLIGAFLSDSYWGRYLTCAVFQLIFVLVNIISHFQVVRYHMVYIWHLIRLTNISGIGAIITDVLALLVPSFWLWR